MTHHGLLFRVGTARRLLAADVARRVAPLPQILRVPGSPPGLLGLALSDGVTLPILEIGETRGAVIVCLCRGEEVGLVGAEDIESGVFEESRIVGATPLDLVALYDRVHAATLGTGWGGER